MRTLLLCTLLSARAWAIDDCFAGARQVDLNNGSSTENYTGIVRCVDRDTKEETRSMSFAHGKLTGTEKRKWPGGDSMEQQYRDGKRHGEYRKYENGKLVEVSHSVDDRELGEGLRYSKTGKLIRKIDRREADAASTWQDFDEAGRLTEAGCGLQTTQQAGLRDCRWKGPSPLVLFHPEGKKRAVIALVDGLRQGLTTTFYADGGKASEERYTKGLRDGLSVEFEGGRPRHSANYALGELSGEEMNFFPDGSKRQITLWKSKVPTSVTEYFQNGARKFELIRDGDRSVESHYDDQGQLEARTPYKKHQVDGVRERFLPDGGILMRWAYVEGQAHGRLQAYRADGRLMEDSQWENGRVTARKHWDEDGGLVEDETFFEDGSRKKRAQR